jgi:hypothetical protein
MSDQKILNTLWVVIPALLAVAMSGRGGKVQVVERGLAAAPVALATDRRPATADGFLWETRCTGVERVFRARDGRTARVTTRPEELLLWCRQVGSAVYWLAGQGPDRTGIPCVVDAPFVLRRASASGAAAVTLRDDLPSASVFVMPSGAVCYADRDGVYRIPAAGGSAELICPRVERNITFWGARGETLFWIEEALPGGRDPVGSCRVVALEPGSEAPRTVAWAPDALTDLVVTPDVIAWYRPAGRTLEGVQPDGRVAVLSRDLNLAATPEVVGSHLFYLCEQPGGRELDTSILAREGRTRLAHLDRSARILGAAGDGVYVGEEEGGRGWFSSPLRTGRLLRVPL